MKTKFKIALVALSLLSANIALADPTNLLACPRSITCTNNNCYVGRIIDQFTMRSDSQYPGYAIDGVYEVSYVQAEWQPDPANYAPSIARCEYQLHAHPNIGLSLYSSPGYYAKQDSSGWNKQPQILANCQIMKDERTYNECAFIYSAQ